jgi:hypothetical protein
MTMATKTDTRKARFRAALALTGKTQEQWAAEAGVTAGHLTHVLAGRRESKVLLDKIEAFTKRHVRAA